MKNKKVGQKLGQVMLPKARETTKQEKNAIKAFLKCFPGCGHISFQDKTAKKKDGWEEEFDRRFYIEEYDIPKVSNKIIKSFISSELQKQREEISKKNLESMEECEPDCTPIRHARHKGSWDHYWKMDRFLSELGE